MDEANATADNPNALASITASADKIVKTILIQFRRYKLNLYWQNLHMKNKIMLLLKSFEKVENSKVKDEGLIQVVKLRLADAQLAQNKYDEALKTLSGDVDPAFKATVEELRGDIFVAKKDIDSAKKHIKLHGIRYWNVNKSDKFYKLNSKVLAF